MKQITGLIILLFILVSGSLAADDSRAKKYGPNHNHLHRHGNVLHNHVHTHKRMHKKYSYTHHHDPDQHDQKQPGLEKQKWIKPGGKVPSTRFPGRVQQPVPTTGGKPAETVEEVERRTPQTLRHRERAVDSTDFKTQTRKIPGVKGVKVRRGPTWRYRYTGITRKTAVRQGIVHRGKIKWRCRKKICKSWVGYRIPRMTDCRKLRTMVGRLKYFGNRYHKLNRKQLYHCNR